MYAVISTNSAEHLMYSKHVIAVVLGSMSDIQKGIQQLISWPDIRE